MSETNWPTSPTIGQMVDHMGESTSGFAQIFNGDTLILNNNEYLSFFCDPDLPFDRITTVTVTNTTDNNTVLDTFTASTTNFTIMPL